MKTRITFIMLIIGCLPLVIFGQAAKLEGYVFDDKNNPVADVRIVTSGGYISVTDHVGHFIMTFPAAVKPGQSIRLQVEKPDWVIYEPLFGDCVTQSTTRNNEPLIVIILPKGSPLLLSSTRISQVITYLIDEKARRAAAPDHKGNLDENAFLRKYAEEHGLRLEALKAALDQWAKANDSKDPEEQAKKAYWRRDYETAALLADQTLPTELERAKYEVREASRNLIRSYTLEGNAYYEQSKFREALSAYRKIEEHFDSKELSREDFKEEWADTKFLLGNTKRELGIRTEGEEGPIYLSDAIRDYEEALSVYTREHVPQKWAITQNNLASALGLLGERRKEPEGEILLRRAIEAFRNALVIFTREQAPQEWATTQNNLGLTFVSLGVRLSDEESIQFLHLAIMAYRQALTIRTREQQPQDWAETQNNLGAVLQVLGERTSRAEGIRYLNEAAAAYHAALEVRTRKQLPQDWAATQNNLGVASMAQAEYLSGEERNHLLSAAILSYQLALEVRTHEQLPQQWAVTQNNLARANLLLQNWKEAATSYENVLSVYPTNEEAYKSLATIYHEQLFEYAKAFMLHQRWLSQFPSDITALADFAETHFTTGRFREFSKRKKSLLAAPSLPVNAKAALQMIDVANLLILNNADQVPAAIATLLKTVEEQEPDFRIVWSFSGTLHFINQRKELSVYRPWLKEFFGVATGENRDAILKTLRRSQDQFRPYRR